MRTAQIGPDLRLRFNGGCFALRSILGGLYLEGLIHGGAYFQNFTVSGKSNVFKLYSETL